MPTKNASNNSRSSAKNKSFFRFGLIIAILAYLSYSAYAGLTQGTGIFASFYEPASINRIVEDTGSGIILYQTEAQERTGTGQIVNTRTGETKTITKQEVEEVAEKNPGVDPLAEIITQEIEKDKMLAAGITDNDREMDRTTPQTTPPITENRYCELEGMLYLANQQVFLDQTTCRRCVITDQGAATWTRPVQCDTTYESSFCTYFYNKLTGETTTKAPTTNEERKNYLARNVYPNQDRQHCQSNGIALICESSDNNNASPTILPVSHPNNRCN